MPSNHRQLFAEAQTLFQQGQLAPAEKLLRELLAARPRDADALLLLGILCTHAQRLPEAIELFQQAVAAKPYFFEALGNLACVYQLAGRHPEAITAFQNLLKLQPTHPLTHYNLGASYKSNRQLKEAAASYRRAIELKPDYADAHYNLGNALRAQRNWDEAITAYKQAIKLRPTLAEASHNLANSYNDKGEHEEALTHYRHALALKPDFADAQTGLASLLRELGHLDESVSTLRKILEINPTHALAAEVYMYTLEFIPDANPRNIFNAHVEWARQNTDTLAPLKSVFPNDPSIDRRLRIAYVSPDFRLHSVAFFIEGLLAHHDHSAFDIFCYSDTPNPDEVTARFQHMPHHWRNTVELSNEQFADQVRADHIDILIDLAGHTAGNRLLALARRIAPIQISTLGYIDTTGMQQIDYRIVDNFTDPPGTTDSLHTEKLLRLPKTFTTYTAPDMAPAPGPLPAFANGHITFACFGSVAKCNTPLLQTYAAILNRVPNSRLLFASSHFKNKEVQIRIAALFQQQGITRDRLDFIGFQPLPDFLALHQRVDILLDTFPANGHTITCHALWMGVPTVSQAGVKYVQRLGTTVLSNLGLTHLLANSPDEFIAIAAKLAADLPSLAALRDSLRSRLQTSLLMDHKTFTREIEAAYRSIWRQWCDSRPEN